MNMSKTFDIGNLRTDTTDNGIEFPIQDYQKNHFSNGPSSFKGFPSTGLLTPTMTTIPSYTSNYLSCTNFMGQTYSVDYLSEAEKNR